MAGRTILVTGVTRFIGSALAGRLASRPDVDRVIGVDVVLPEPAARRRMGEAEFARADIRNPLIGRVLEAAGVDTVVHASSTATPVGSAARSMAKEMNVLGTMQLLAACQRAEGLQHLVVRSSARVYGGSSRDPAVMTEDSTARSLPSGSSRDAVDIEGYVRGFGRRRPDVRIVVPRLAEVVGPHVQTPLTQYFAQSPFVAVAAGRDGRLQLLHEDDAVAVLEHLAMGGAAGTVNVAGPGTMTVTQAIRRAGRIPVPVPALALDGVGALLRLSRIPFSAETVRLLSPGRVMDTSRLVNRFHFTPAYSTVAAFDDFVRRLRPAVPAEKVRQVEQRLVSALGLRPDTEDGDAAAPVAAASGAGRPRLVSIDGGRDDARPRRSTR